MRILTILPSIVLLSSTVLVQSLAADQPDPRLFELRTYHALPGKLDPLLARFRNHTIRLFAKHEMTNIGYWVPVDNKDNLLVYLLAYPDHAARDASWKGFLEDEDWKKAAAASEVDGKLVEKVDQPPFPRPPLRPPALSTAPPHPHLQIRHRRPGVAPAPSRDPAGDGRVRGRSAPAAGEQPL